MNIKNNDVYEYALLEVLGFLYDIGGCESQDGWSSGYDQAVNEVEEAILQLGDKCNGELRSKYDQLMDYKIDRLERERVAFDNIQLDIYKKALADVLEILGKIGYQNSHDDESKGFNEAMDMIYNKVKSIEKE